MKKLVLLAILFSLALPLQVEAQTQVNSIKFANRPDYHPTTIGNLWRKNDQLIWTYSGGESIISTGGGGGGGTLAGLSDVTLGTLYHGQLLGYDGISGQWENKWPWETSVDGRYVTTSTTQTLSGAKTWNSMQSFAQTITTSAVISKGFSDTLDAQPLTIYCGPAGSDATGDGSFANPFRKVKRALDAIPDVGRFTVTIRLKAGSYTGFWYNSKSNSDTGNDPAALLTTVLVRSDTGVPGSVTITGSGDPAFPVCVLAAEFGRPLTLQYLTITPAVDEWTAWSVYGASLEILNCVVTGAQGAEGMWATDTSFLDVRNTTMSYAGTGGCSMGLFYANLHGRIYLEHVSATGVLLGIGVQQASSVSTWDLSITAPATGGVLAAYALGDGHLLSYSPLTLSGFNEGIKAHGGGLILLDGGVSLTRAAVAGSTYGICSTNGGRVTLKSGTVLINRYVMGVSSTSAGMVTDDDVSTFNIQNCTTGVTVATQGQFRINTVNYTACGTNYTATDGRYQGDSYVAGSSITTGAGGTRKLLDNSAVTGMGVGNHFLYNNAQNYWRGDGMLEAYNISKRGVAVATSVASCYDTNLTTLAGGHFLRWNASTGRWHPVVLPPSVTDLASLTDVDVTTKANGNLLMYDGSKWYNVTPSVLPTDGRYVTTATVQTIPAAKVWQGTQTMSELRAAAGTGLSIKDSAGTTQIYLGSRPDFPNGSTLAMGQTQSTTYYVSTTGTASNSGLTPALAVDSFDSAMAKVSVGYVGQINIRYLSGSYAGFLWRGQGNAQAGKQRLNGLEALVVESDSGNRADVVFDRAVDGTGDYLMQTVWSGSPVIIAVMKNARIQLRNVTVKSSADYANGLALYDGSHVDAHNCTFKMEHDYAYVMTASRKSSVSFTGDTTCTGYASPLNSVFSIYDGSTFRVDWGATLTCTDYDAFGYADVNSHVELDGPVSFSSPVGHVNSYWVLDITNNSTLVNLAYPSGITMNNVRFAVRMRGHGYLYLGYDMTLNLIASGIGIEMADDSVLCGHGGTLRISGPSPSVKASAGLGVSRSSYAGGFGGWSLPLNISNCSIGVSITGNATLNTVTTPVFSNCTTNIYRADGAYGELNYSDFDRYIGGRMCYIGSLLTVASDAVTVIRSRHTLNGQGAVADNLVTINGGVVAGQKLTLVRGNADITLKHGTGNIRCGGADIVLNDANDRVEFEWDGASTWNIMSRSAGPDAATYATSSTVPGAIDYVYCNISGGSISLSLPQVAKKTWRFKVTSHAATNVVTLTPLAGNIDGAASNDTTLTTVNDSCDVHCDGTNFWIH